LGNYDTVQVIRKAIAALNARFEGLWVEDKWDEVDEVWESIKILRRELDDFEDSQRESIRLT